MVKGRNETVGALLIKMLVSVKLRSRSSSCWLRPTRAGTNLPTAPQSTLALEESKHKCSNYIANATNSSMASADALRPPARFRRDRHRSRDRF